MEIYEILKIKKQIDGKLDIFLSRINSANVRQEIVSLENKMSDPEFWNDNKQAQIVVQTVKLLNAKVKTLDKLIQTSNEIKILTEEAAGDTELMELLDDEFSNFQVEFITFEESMLFDQENDIRAALIEINPGAGGTESQDWALMLYRMYLRFCEKSGMDVEVLNYQNGDEAGIKNAVIRVSGEYAFGRLKSESGVHRLVRISPFDSQKRRHTSFASILVTPDVEAAQTIEIKDVDLKIDTFRSSGAGGQSVNTTDSAVRITHLPTGIVVSCQNERSQISNRDKAMEMLRIKLFQRQREEEMIRKAKLAGEKAEIGFGSQIRSYVFHPYSLVKDHRTGFEFGNAQAVIDGELEGFVISYLQSLIE